MHIDGIGYWEGTVGYSHSGQEMTSDMLLGIGSNTKLFTAVLCMKFKEAGLLSLNDSLYMYLPQYENIDTNITIKQLLQHNAGLDDYVNYTMPDLVIDEPNHVWVPEEMLAYVGEPIYEPGQQVKYSSTGYVLAAMILEEISGTQWHTLVRDSILIPLELGNTYMEAFEELGGNLAHPWYLGEDLIDLPRTAIGTLSWSAGCIVSTPKDMSKWYDKLFNGNFLSTESINEMTDFINWLGYPYNMGIGIYEITEYPHTYWGHSGQTIGFNSLTYYHPENKSTISVIINDTYKSPNSINKALGARIDVVLSAETTLSNIDKNVQLFPNPVQDHTNIINFDDETIENITILSMKSSIIDKIENINDNKYNLNCSHYPKGIYLLQIKTKSHDYIKKMVKM